MSRIRILMQPVRDYVAMLWTTLTSGWSRFWFQPTDPVTLAFMRICAGLVVVYIYASCAPERLNLIGPHAWIDAQALSELQQLGQQDSSMQWWGQSVWFSVKNDTVASMLYWYLIGAGICMTIGFFSRTANLLVLIGHLSFVHRSYVAWFGMDSILAMILLYLVIGPTGDALSIDRWLRRRTSQSAALDNTIAVPPSQSWTANLSVRMIQIHMCVIYLCSGLAKLQGETWWDGTAVLRSLMGYELAPVDLRWVGSFSDTTLEWFSSLSVVATLVFEIGFAFLIWNKMLRPLLLTSALFLHVGIAASMGLFGFGVIMMTGCVSFIAPESIRWVIAVLQSPSQVAEPSASLAADVRTQD